MHQNQGLTLALARVKHWQSLLWLFSATFMLYRKDLNKKLVFTAAASHYLSKVCLPDLLYLLSSFNK